ncbi:unnamed protein product [Polarella glacialis]|nr:unnamed protein product [Polarella glacialis]
MEMPDMTMMVARAQEDLDDSMLRVEQTSWALWCFLVLSWFAGFSMRGWMQSLWQFAEPRYFARVKEENENEDEKTAHIPPADEQTAVPGVGPVEPPPSAPSAPSVRREEEVQTDEEEMPNARVL